MREYPWPLTLFGGPSGFRTKVASSKHFVSQEQGLTAHVWLNSTFDPAVGALTETQMGPRFVGTAAPTFFPVKEFETYTLLNATQDAEALQMEESLSSAVALAVVLVLFFSLIATSLATHCFHKWKLRGKRLQKAQEEYQRDHEKTGFRSTSRLDS